MSASKEQSLAANLNRNLWVLAVLTVAFLVTLAIAPAKGYLSDWRDIQNGYNDRAAAAGLPAMEVGLQQVWRPEIGLTDRCMTCHVGMGATKPIADGGALYGRHPEVFHDVGRMGCTLCHRGQGRATSTDDAHGYVEHWEDPMLPRELLQASCGPCHGNAAPIAHQQLAERGRYLFELHGCSACHVVDGVGGDVGPDLSAVALKGYSHDWQVQHLRQPAGIVEGSRMMNFGHLMPGDVEALIAYLDTLIGAPELARGKALAVEAGCRGCHVIGGIGGDVGPDLSNTGAKLAADRDFTHIEGPHTNEAWHRAHLRNPKAVAPSSKMPAFNYSPDDERALITYIMSLREPDVPLEQLPERTIMMRLTKARDFDSHDGAQVFRALCSACHGVDGLGRDLKASLGATVPSVTNPFVLEYQSDDFLRATLELGRVRGMPAWIGSKAGPTDEEVDALIAFLRGHEQPAPSFEQVMAWPNPDPELGGRVFRGTCAGCHGDDGAGTEIAPSLVNAEFRFVADDRYLYETITRGRRNTAMISHAHLDAETLAGLLAWFRSLPTGPVVIGSARVDDPAAIGPLLAETLFVDSLASYRATGSAAYGATLFKENCQGCHGPEGQGGLGPAIANPDFLAAASDGFLAASMLLGRGERPMRPFGPTGLATLQAREVGDLIVYLRDVSRTPRPRPGIRRVQGDDEAGAELFARYCVNCHGADGVGGTGPALHDPGLLGAASDGYLQAIIARGRPGTAMKPFAGDPLALVTLEPKQINDIVSYIRGWQSAGAN